MKKGPNNSRTRSDCIFEQNMGLIVSLVKSFKPKSRDEFDEYVQLGRIGLWKASNEYKAELGQFSTIAWYYIKWEIIRHIEKSRKIPKSLSIDEFDHLASNEELRIDDYIPTNLSKLEKEVIQYRHEGYTFSEIGKKMGYSRAWANHTFRLAINKIINEHGKETHLNV